MNRSRSSVFVIAALAALLAGCTDNSGAVGTLKPAGSPEPTISAPKLTGWPTDNFDCPRRIIPQNQVSSGDEMNFGSVVSLKVCGVTRKAQTLTSTDPDFQQVLVALGSPDERPPTPNFACAAIAYPPWLVLASTGQGKFRVRLPHSACQYLPESVSRVLQAAGIRPGH